MNRHPPPTPFGEAITDVELSPHKVVLHAERLMRLAADEDIFPVTLELDLVDHCNHRCGWCVDPHHGNTRIDANEAKALLVEMRELGLQGVVFKGGGEPTLHPQFAALLSYARGLGLDVGVVTNGSRLRAVGPTVAEQASYLRVSLDGPTAASHRAVHGSTDFSEILEGIQMVVARRGRLGQRHPIIGLSFAMDHSLLAHVAEAARLGAELEVDYVLFRTPFFEEVGRTPTMSPAAAHQVREAFRRVQREQTGPLRVLVDPWVGDSEAAEAGPPAPETPALRRGTYRTAGTNGIEHLTRRCLACPLLVVVTADQRVYPCCNLRALDGWSLGRIDRAVGNTFGAVWGSLQRREVMERVRRTDCLRHCTHPLSRFNEIIEYLRTPRYHGGFI